MLVASPRACMSRQVRTSWGVRKGLSCATLSRSPKTAKARSTPALGPMPLNSVPRATIWTSHACSIRRKCSSLLPKRPSADVLLPMTNRALVTASLKARPSPPLVHHSRYVQTIPESAGRDKLKLPSKLYFPECSQVLKHLRPRRDDEDRSEEHTSELQSRENLVCRLLLEKK